MFWTLLELHFSGLKSILFYPEYQKIFLSGFLCLKNIWEKGRFFDKNNGLAPLQNVDFLDFFRTSLLRSKENFFTSRISKHISFLLSLLKKTYKKKVDFLKKKKPWTNLCQIPVFSTFLELHFSDINSILSYPEYQKMLLLGCFCYKKKHIKKKFDVLTKTMD